MYSQLGQYMNFFTNQIVEALYFLCYNERKIKGMPLQVRGRKGEGYDRCKY